MHKASRLTIYAGFHKAGTSAIQSALAQKSSELRALGIEYPAAYGKFAHHRLAKFTLEDTKDRSFKAIKRACSRHDRVLLASEFFSEFDATTLSELSELLGPEVDVEVIFSLRSLEKVVVSQYQQFVRTGYRQSIEHFALSLLDYSDSEHEATLFWRRHSYSQIVRRWLEICPPESIHVVMVDESDPKMLTSWFEEFLGLPPESLLGQASKSLNRSLDAEEVQLVLAIREYLEDARLKREWVRIFRDTFIREIVSKPSSNPESQRLSLGPVEEREFRDRAILAEREISSLGVRVYGQVTRSDVDERNKRARKPTHIHIDTVARAITKIRPSHYLSVLSSRQLLRELVARFLRPISRLFPK